MPVPACGTAPGPPCRPPSGATPAPTAACPPAASPPAAETAPAAPRPDMRPPTGDHYYNTPGGVHAVQHLHLRRCFHLEMLEPHTHADTCP